MADGIHCFLGKPQGNQLVGVGLEQASQFHDLGTLGMTLAVLITAVHGYVHADGFGETALQHSLLLAQGANTFTE